MRENLKAIGTAAAALAAVAVVGFVVVMNYFVLPQRMAADLSGAPTRHGAGTVTSISYQQAIPRQPDPPFLVLVRLNGRSERVLTRTPLRVGQVVPIRYRVGKSGKTYITQVGSSPVD